MCSAANSLSSLEIESNFSGDFSIAQVSYSEATPAWSDAQIALNLNALSHSHSLKHKTAAVAQLSSLNLRATSSSFLLFLKLNHFLMKDFQLLFRIFLTIVWASQLNQLASYFQQEGQIPCFPSYSPLINSTSYHKPLTGKDHCTWKATPHTLN